MARIRTIKPDLFRHEGLQELQSSTTLPVILVFMGLFCQADREGRFKWSPRILKLDILPFLPFDMEATLIELAKAGFVRHYAVDGKEYGSIPSWSKHQLPNAREAKSVIPSCDGACMCTHVKDTAMHVHARGEGNGREGVGNGNGVGNMEGVGKGSSRSKSGDPRHASFKSIVGLAWKAKNTLAMPWDASEAKQLSSLLSANPTLYEEAFTELLRNRHNSRVNHSERPRQWLARLTDFGNGPLDQYGKPLRGEGSDGKNDIRVSPAVQRQRASDDGIERAFQMLAGSENTDEPGQGQLPEPGYTPADGPALAGRMGGSGGEAWPPLVEGGA